MPVPLSDLDKKAVLYLRDAYLRDDRNLDPGELAKTLGLDSFKVHSVIQGMVAIGALDDHSRQLGSSPFRSELWKINPRVAMIAAEVETPPDHLEEFMAMLNRKEWTYGWVLFVVGLAGVVTFLNQLFELIEHIAGLTAK